MNELILFFAGGVAGYFIRDKMSKEGEKNETRTKRKGI